MCRLYFNIEFVCFCVTLRTAESSRFAPPESSEWAERSNGESAGVAGTSAFLSARAANEKSAAAGAKSQQFYFHAFDERAREDAYQKTEAREHPYSVLLYTGQVHRNGSASIVGTCSGSLIALDWVLTAAHCFRVKHYHVVGAIVIAGAKINSYFRGEPLLGEPREVQIARETEWHVHPGYSLDHGIDYDLALVKLSRPFALTEYVRPIKLSDSPWERGYRGCSVTAFGKANETDESHEDNYVRKTQSLEVGRPCACGPAMAASLGAGAASRLVCAELKQDFGICQGDSGGGLACGGRLAAVASFSLNVDRAMESGACDRDAPLEDVHTECATKNELSVFQDVYPSLSWIKSTARGAAGSLPRYGAAPLLFMAALLPAF